tara:strand:- start:15369 stop:15722 length:354 start_codon:yes stop_codon:yes gene_type:complete
MEALARLVLDMVRVTMVSASALKTILTMDLICVRRLVPWLPMVRYVLGKAYASYLVLNLVVYANLDIEELNVKYLVRVSKKVPNRVMDTVHVPSTTRCRLQKRNANVLTFMLVMLVK